MNELIAELRREAETTRRVLERTPEEKLDWRPHEKSMTLGQLAWHVATIPGNLSKLAALGEFDASQANFEPPRPESKAAIVAALEESVEQAAGYLDSVGGEELAAPWRLTLRGSEVFTMPRGTMLRSILFNHWYHHRGQLTVYLRLLDVAVPVVYGRSADEKPFG